MRTRILFALCITGLLFGLASPTRAQPVGPGRLLPQRPFPAKSGVAPSPKKASEEPRLSGAGAVAAMKLLAPNVGWALSMGRLLWTANGGMEWKDITPPAPTDAEISTVFFLDTSRGWVLLAHGEPDVIGGTQFELASTDSAGAAWSIRPVTIPKRKYGGILNSGSLAFADSRHGWLALTAGVSAAFQGVGVLLKTSDGGETWKLATATGWDKYDTIGPMFMQTPEQGWMVGAGGNEPLLGTHDGGRTWQRIELESPVKTDLMRKYDRNLEQVGRSFQALPPAAAKLVRKEPQHRLYAAYDLPTFEDPKHGYICVTYPGVIVLFKTDDGGVSWKPDRVLTGLQEQQTGWKAASALVDSTWIAGGVPKGGVPRLRKLGPDDHNETNTAPSPEDFNITHMSFATPSQGWVRTNYYKLLATNDGGASWTDITPGRGPQARTP